MDTRFCPEPTLAFELLACSVSTRPECSPGVDRCTLRGRLVVAATQASLRPALEFLVPNVALHDVAPQDEGLMDGVALTMKPNTYPSPLMMTKVRVATDSRLPDLPLCIFTFLLMSC